MNQSGSSRARIGEISRAVRMLLQELASGSIKFAQLLNDINRKLDRVPEPTTVVVGGCRRLWWSRC